MASVRSGSNPIPTTSARPPVDNPYASNAYATSRAPQYSAANAYSDVGGSMGSGMPYPSGKPKANMQDKLKDTLKSTMAAAKKDNWNIVCVKATNHDVAPPKGKHIRDIMNGLRHGGSISNRESPAGGIFYHLRKRMMLNQWLVAFKAQMIFHHIFRDGNEKFVDYVAANSRSMFKMDFFADATSDGFTHSVFIRSYGAYIEQWLAMKAAVKFPPGKSKEDDPTITRHYRNAPIEDLRAALPVIMDTVDELFNLQISGPTRFTPAANPDFSMILRDLTILWISLSEGMIRLLDLFLSLDQSSAQISLDACRSIPVILVWSPVCFNQWRLINLSMNAWQM